MKKILITGFEPFQKENINPSEKLVELYRGRAHTETLILPVSYRRSWEVLRSHLENQKHDFNFVLMLGQAGGRSAIGLEKAALNLQDAEVADEDGEIRLQQRISPMGPDAFLSPLLLRDWVHALHRKNLPVEVSLSAGAFVCNSLYYQVLEHFKSRQQALQALFVHVPFLKEQVLGKTEGKPFLKLEMMKETIDELLLLIGEPGSPVPG